ncbi:MAG: dihydroorotate dehydrogenase (quinone), partial [Burkholderiales bacterium]
MLYQLARPVLFALDAERAHDLAFAGLEAASRCGLAKLVTPRPASSPAQIMGLRFDNRVGLAAGLDKNGAHIDALATLGFGFLEVGTVTPRPQPGNPRPRLFRLAQAQALINRMGFNNVGVERFLENVRRARYRGVLGVNIGKNFDTPIERAADDYLHCLRRVYEHASYVTVNVSSPNTKDLRSLQQASALAPLLAALGGERDKLAAQYARRLPLAVKIAPDLQQPEIEALARLVVDHGFDAVIATNTTT